MTLFGYAFRYIKKFRLILSCLVISSTASVALSIVTTYMLGKYLDSVTSERFEVVVWFTLLITALYAVEMIARYFSQTSGVKLQLNATYYLCYDLVRHVQKLHLSFYLDKDTAYLSQRLNSDTSSLVGFVLNNIVALITKALSLVVVLYLLLRINAGLTLALVPLIALYAIQYRYFKKPLYASNYELREQQSKYFSELNAQVSNMKFAKLNALFVILNRMMREAFCLLYEIQLKNTRLQYWFSSGGLIIKYVMMIVMFMYGGWLIINKQLTIGDFIVFNNYFGMMIGYATYYLSVGQEFQNAKVSYIRIQEILGTPQEINGSKLIDTIEKIEAKNISFGYSYEHNIITDKSLTFEKGKIYCLKGDNGAGKSTLVAILLGLYNGHFQGEVLYNGIDIKELDLYELRKNVIGVSEQEPFLLQASVRENITPVYETGNAPEISLDEAIKFYIENLRLDEFINKQPERLEYRLDSRNGNMSGGEKQKLSQIRALVKKPQLLVLDEPTSALDKESIVALKDILLAEKSGRITIIVTHHGEFANIADEVIAL